MSEYSKRPFGEWVIWLDRCAECSFPLTKTDYSLNEPSYFVECHRCGAAGSANKDDSLKNAVF